MYNCDIDIAGEQGNNAIVKESTYLFFVDDSHDVSPQSDFHLADSLGVGAATDGTDIGIYGGEGFKDDCLVPIPRIVSFQIKDRTDVNGKLKIRIEAKFD